MLILFLDDQKIRHDIFCGKDHDYNYDTGQFTKDCAVVHAQTASEAIEALKNNDFDAVCLDHDLGDEKTQGCGFDVVDYLVTMPILPRLVIIHSWNTTRSHEMARKLKENSKAHVIVSQFSRDFTVSEVRKAVEVLDKKNS